MSGPPTSLLLFTTSQTPLPPRYPHPTKPRLQIPSFLHASLHSALDRDPPSFKLNPDGVLLIPDPKDGIDDVNGDFSTDGVVHPKEPEDDEYDAEITVKMYLVNVADLTVDEQKKQIARAVRNLTSYKGNDKRWQGRAGRHIDTFLVGWKNIDYVGQKEGAEIVPAEGLLEKAKKAVGSAKLMSKLGADRDRYESNRAKAKAGEIDEDEKKTLTEVWCALPSLIPQAQQLGVLSFPLPLLQLISASCPPDNHPPSPSYNSLPSRAGLDSMLADQPTAAEEQEKEKENPDTISSMSSSGEKQTRQRRESKASVEDKQLLDELIRTPPSRSPRVKHDTLPLPDTGDGPIGGTGSAARAPRVNSLSTPDCHSLPEGLQSFAKDKGIELWAGGSGEGGSDPLPSIHLHNTLSEFIDHLPAGLLPSTTNLSKLVEIEEDVEGGTREKLGVNVEWVLGYTVVSKSRNVVEDKGYIISAALT